MKHYTDLIDTMSDEIIKIRNGQTTASNVNATVNATGKILAAIKLKMEYDKLQSKRSNIPMMEDKK